MFLTAGSARELSGVMFKSFSDDGGIAMRKTFVYKCPVCGCPVKNRPWDEKDLTQAKYYSDGYPDSEIYPNYPALTECRMCQNIFLMSKKNLIGSTEEYRGTMQLSDMPYGGPVSNGEAYLNSLELCTTDKQRILLRTGAWWAFNRTYLRTKDIDIYRRKDYIDNCRILIKHYERSLSGDVLLAAEMYRNLGEFDKCKEMMNMYSRGMSYLRKQIIPACESGRIETFEIKPERRRR